MSEPPQKPTPAGPYLGAVFALTFTLMFALHATLLRLPYFWDEAGYFVPAARDLLLSGDPIPASTVSNAHPPLVTALLALWWKLGAFTPLSTRTAMLLVAALALTGVFRLARQVSNLEVAAATTLLTALYPVFFAQSSLVHLDMAAAAFTLWGLSFYLEGRRWPAVALFSLAALAKETAIVAPFALLLWELAQPMVARRWAALGSGPVRRSASLLLLPALPLALWYAYHAHRTGYIFGNPEFVRYNLSATLDPLRILLAGLRRLWHLTGYMNLWLLTGITAFALRRPALQDGGQPRLRVDLGIQAVFAVVILAYVAMLSVLGGAVLARYLLPVAPLGILLCVSTLRRRLRHWLWVVSLVSAGFVAGWLLNPPYPFAPEDNLAYRDYVTLHKRAADFLSARYPHARVLTAWPASDELTKPYLGYTREPFAVVAVQNFSAAPFSAAARDSSRYDVALLFSTKYQPPQNLFDLVPFWEQVQERYFDYHRDLSAEDAARMLGGRVVWREQRQGEWVAVIEIERALNALNLRQSHRDTEKNKR
ncbi:MAG TPA: glycosyltransferase family 39 protein [Terriglobales bacterium]|nr:glycosyltransferase family 39 protein [Terriglobales bacterium]